MTEQRLTMLAIQYGRFVDQQADLHLPNTPRPAVVCLLHGGFWRMPFGRDQMAAIADDLVARGLAVWNMEYRRLGALHAGWPTTMDDAPLASTTSPSFASQALTSILTESFWSATPRAGS